METNYILSSRIPLAFGTQTAKPWMNIKLFSGTTLLQNWRFDDHLKRGRAIKSLESLKVLAKDNGKSIDENELLNLDEIRHSLIRQEDSIIFSLLERSQYGYNLGTYDPDAFHLEGFSGSLVEYMLKETEMLHSQIGRYKNPEEHPFFPNDLPSPLFSPPLPVQFLHVTANSININNKIWDVYFKDLLPGFTKDGDDTTCGSAAVCDIVCLQALSKRIHYGKYVAEAKFQGSPETYTPAIVAQDRSKLMNLVTFKEVEDAVRKRIEIKVKRLGTLVPDNPDDATSTSDAVYKINPNLIADFYEKWVMPLTKEVQVEYLLKRLN